MPENMPLAISNFIQDNTIPVSGATQYVQPVVMIGNAMPSVDTVDPKFYNPGVTVGIDGNQNG